MSILLIESNPFQVNLDSDIRDPGAAAPSSAQRSPEETSAPTTTVPAVPGVPGTQFNRINLLEIPVMEEKQRIFKSFLLGDHIGCEVGFESSTGVAALCPTVTASIKTLRKMCTISMYILSRHPLQALL